MLDHAFLALHDEYSHCDTGYCFVQSTADKILPYCDKNTDLRFIMQKIKEHPDSIEWSCSYDDIEEHLYEIIEQHIPDYFHIGCRYNNPACPSTQQRMR